LILPILWLDRRRRLAIERAQRALATIEHDHRQAEALIRLYQMISPRQPLALSNAFAASPDLLERLVSVIRERRPSLVLELGSGTSTVVMAYALEQLGSGRIISIDHDAVFAERVAEVLAEHRLQGIAEIRHAPLVEIDIDGAMMQWYDPLVFNGIDSIDLLLVDGPPGQLGPLARYPAMPILKPRLRPEALVILDDGDRAGERGAVARWCSEFGVRAEHLALARGAWIIGFGSMPASACQHEARRTLKA
jgi:predicted O-methyltransferase YrrM